MSPDTTRGPLSERQINELADFNGRVAQGIVHTEAFVARMQNYQQRWYDHHANRPEIKRRRWVW